VKTRAVIVLVAVLGACNKKIVDPVVPYDAATDAADAPSPVDARDAQGDRGLDAGGDARADTRVDAGIDASVDAADAGIDVSADVGVDLAIDRGVDVGVDLVIDAGVDAGSDAGCTDCWKTGVFGPPSGWPRTVQRTGTTMTSDYQCVVVFGTTGCLAQNDPPCHSVAETRTATLNLTIQADGSVTVQAPYQDMCTSDYVGGVVDAAGNPTGEPVPTSYAVPLASRLWYFAPRSIDHCRVDLNGIDTLVQHKASTAVDQTLGQILITQDCATTLRDDTNGSSLLHDTRHYVTRVSF